MSRLLVGLGLMALVLAVLLSYSTRSTATVGIEDTPENRELVDALQRYYDTREEAIDSGDLDALHEILINDPVYERSISREEATELKEYIARVSGPERAKDFGYLTVVQNSLTHRLLGQELLEGEMAKARAEGRAWTDADTDALADRNFGVPPSPRSEPGNKYPLNVGLDWFHSIKVDGDYAYVTFERVALWSAIFKRVDGHWYIAAIYR